MDEVKAFLEERLAFAVGEGIAEERVLLDPGHRLRQDARAQPRAAAPARRARGARAAARGRDLAQELSRADPRRGEPCERRSGWGAARGGEAAAAGRRRAAARARSPPTCWPTSAAPACFACTTSPRCAPRSRWRLLRWAAMSEDAMTSASGRRGPDGRAEATERCEEPGAHEDEDADEDEARRRVESVTIEITGLSLYTHHGVSEAEREVGQRLVLDLRLDVGETDATVTDRIEDTVDYAEVCQLVALSPSSAPTRRSSGSAARSPIACSPTSSSKACGSRPPSPSRRSRCRSTRSRSRSGARPRSSATA